MTTWTIGLSQDTYGQLKKFCETCNKDCVAETGKEFF
jgi:hypothetical protein